MRFVIAIDGTSSSGKTTTAKLLAKRLKIKYIDTGAMYRCVTLDLLKNNIPLDNDDVIKERLKNIDIHFDFSSSCNTRVFLNGEDVTEEIRTPQVDKFVSVVSEKSFVRKVLVEMQRKMAEDEVVVCEGRDIGTVVFPDADLKIFMIADIEERAKRRYKELKEKGIEVSLEEVKKNLQERDRIDSSRKCSPLKKAEDAFLLDTTYLTIQEQVEIIENLIRKKMQER